MAKRDYRIEDIVPTEPKRSGEYADGEGGDANIHAAMLGDDDAYITEIPAVPVARVDSGHVRPVRKHANRP